MKTWKKKIHEFSSAKIDTDVPISEKPEAAFSWADEVEEELPMSSLLLSAHRASTK